MIKLFNKESIFNLKGHNMICIQGDYTGYYNEEEDCIESNCPIHFVNIDLIDIDEDGMWLELPEEWEKDNTWCLYETDCTGKKENYLDSEILSKESSWNYKKKSN